MSNGSPSDSPTVEKVNQPAQSARWHTFPEILSRLHQEKIYIHPDQLAEFMLFHGLPVDLRYVPKHLRQRAKVINDNYRGDMAREEVVDDLPGLLPLE
jgi:hypothetical protein